MLLRFSLLCCIALPGLFSALAQPPRPSLSAAAADSVPPTTVVPVIQPPESLYEHTTVYEKSTRGMDRAQRRTYRAEVYAAHIDSLVQSRDWMFFPNTMQQTPGGLIRSIYTGYFYFGMFVDHVEVHLPTERGLTQYIEMVDFDSSHLRDYRAARLPWGWMLTLDVADGDVLYRAEFEVSTATGETVLTLLTPRLTMRYVGWLWSKKLDDRRRYRTE